MIKEVQYNGYTAMPSDYECPDGNLASVMGLVLEDDALRPILPPKPVLALKQGYRVLCIHKVGTLTNYILEYNGASEEYRLEFLSDGKYKGIVSGLRGPLRQVVAIGNTLVTLTDDGMRYSMWSDDKKGYDDLGQRIPECPLSFGLHGELALSDPFDISFNTINSNGGQFSDGDIPKITAAVLAKVNKFIADRSINKSYFLFPFFVRYAYRLYDGTLSHHSAPVLMICSSGVSPQVATRVTSAGNISSAKCVVYGMVCGLDYVVTDSTALSELRKWNDIVRSVEIFISAPIYTYDQSGECKSFGKTDPGYALCECGGSSGHSMIDIASRLSGYNNGFGADFAPILPRKDSDIVAKTIAGCHQFYLLKSFELEQLSSARSYINIPDDYLQSLSNRETMTDDYDSHDHIIPQCAYIYNSRLNIANLKKRFFNGFPSISAFGYHDKQPNKGEGPVTCYVYIKQDGKTIIVDNISGVFCWDPWLVYFYYPNPNAYKAVIYQSGFIDDMGAPYSKFREISLTPHEYLNGAVYFGGWAGVVLAQGEPSITISTNVQRNIDLPNKIYTSEIGNPFFFPLKGINTVGTGTILGICSAVKALSQGQFGQFPLYAFTTEGVWALEVSETGTYTARQPVTRDVCINADSITQIDNAVLFAADRGIMLISGSNSVCISDVLNSDDPFSLPTFPCGEDLIYKAEFSIDTFDYLPFKEFLVDCRMIYDYTHQRIIVYNRGCLYAYVYSLKSKQWGMMESNISGGVNSYPEALAMTWHDGLVDFAQSDETIGLRGLIITRPLKLENPDVLKTVDTVIQRGFFRKGHVATALYGSRDLYNWHLIFSSKDHYLRGFRGTPYKYYRVALICKLDKDESVFGCTVQYTPRLLNQPR